MQGDDLDYLGIPGLHIAGNQGVAIIAIAQFLLMVIPSRVLDAYTPNILWCCSWAWTLVLYCMSCADSAMFPPLLSPLVLLHVGPKPE